MTTCGPLSAAQNMPHLIINTVFGYYQGSYSNTLLVSTSFTVAMMVRSQPHVTPGGCKHRELQEKQNGERYWPSRGPDCNPAHGTARQVRGLMGDILHSIGIWWDNIQEDEIVVEYAALVTTISHAESKVRRPWAADSGQRTVTLRTEANTG